MHFENERDHQCERCGAADPWKQTDRKAECHAHQHQAESFPLKNEEKPFYEGVEHDSSGIPRQNLREYMKDGELRQRDSFGLSSRTPACVKSVVSRRSREIVSFYVAEMQDFSLRSK